MSNVDAGVVFLPRFTTLVGATQFTTAPVDVSQQGGVQFQIWRGPIRSSGGTPALNQYLEESLDARTWVLGPATPAPITVEEDDLRFCSYSFRLRWFRLRFALTGTNPMVSCWAEGLLRGADGSGVWGAIRNAAAGEVDGRAKEPRPATRQRKANPWLPQAKTVTNSNGETMVLPASLDTPMGWWETDPLDSGQAQFLPGP
jgi:hypothetical protein